VEEQGTRRPHGGAGAAGSARSRSRTTTPPSAHALVCSSAHPPAYAALHSSGGADNPACHWLYDTLLFPDPDLRLASASLQPVWQAAAAAAVSLASLYGRVRASPPPSSRHGARRLADGAPAVGRRSRRRSSRRRGPAVGGAGVHQRRGSGAGDDQRLAQDAGEGRSGGRGRQAAGVEGREREKEMLELGGIL